MPTWVTTICRSGTEKRLKREKASILERLAAQARQWADASGPVGGVLVDYLQLVAPLGQHAGAGAFRPVHEAQIGPAQTSVSP